MRKVFNTVFDFVTGFDLSGELKKVLEMDNWSREAIDNYQHEKFENLKSFAGKTEIYKGCSSTKFEDFPKYSKTFVQKNIVKFRNFDRKSYRIIYTSGSTGNPKKIYVSKEMILAKRTSYLKMLRWYNLKRDDKVVYIGGLSQPFSMQVYYFLKNKIYLPSNDITKEKAGKYIRIINQKKPKILFSYPYALDIILNYAEEMQESLHQPVVVYTGGENLHPDVRDHIRKHFHGSHIVNEYWSTEGNIGVSCPEGKMHADEDTIIIESDNEDENGYGDLLITNFYSYDMPVIRYDLGDRIKLSDTFCSCGRRTKVIEGIEGRNVDYYYLKDGRRIAYMDMRVSQFVENIIVYQIVHNRKDDSFLFKYVPGNDTHKINKPGLHNFFSKNLGVELYFKEVGHIPSEPSGKYRIFKSI